MSSDSPLHVRSGAFKVDRAEALRKLASFQLAEPLSFPLCWVRAGVASGASGVAIELSNFGLEVHFDGEPWTPEELADPYAYFFEAEGPKAARTRHLVVGALACFRAGCPAMWIEGGDGGPRDRVRLGPQTVEHVPPRDTQRGTVLFAEWGDDLPESDRLRTIAIVRERCGMLRVPMSIRHGGDIGAAPRLTAEGEFPAAEFEDGGLRGVLSLPPDPEAASSQVHLYSGGVMASTIEWGFPLAQASASLDGPGFALDASHSSVVLNAEFQRALDRAGERVEPLLEQALSKQERSYWAMTRFLFEGHVSSRVLRRLKWHRNGLLDFLLAAAVGRAEERDRLLQWEQKELAWLRQTAARIPDRLRDRPLVKRLFDAPLYLTVTGETISVAELERLEKRVGVLPVSHLPHPGMDLDPPVLWCPRTTDPVLAKRFAGEVRWYKDVESFRNIGRLSRDVPERRLPKRPPPAGASEGGYTIGHDDKRS